MDESQITKNKKQITNVANTNVETSKDNAIFTILGIVLVPIIVLTLCAFLCLAVIAFIASGDTLGGYGF